MEERAPTEHPERMWIGFALLAVSVVIVVIAYSSEETAEMVGAGFAPPICGLIGAAVLRLIWAGIARIRDRRFQVFEFSGFILCAGIVAAVFGTMGAIGHADDEQTQQDTSDALEQLDLQDY